MIKENIIIPELNIQSFQIKIKGLSPILFNKWSEKAKQMILDKQMKKASSNKQREAKDPEADGEATFYKNSKGEICIPAICLKSAIVGGCRSIKDLPMTVAKGAIFVLGDEDELIKMEYKSKKIQSDMVRVATGGADIRFRGRLDDWYFIATVQFNADVISAEQLVNLINVAGWACGLCEWRPQKGGNLGRFRAEVIK